MSLVVLVQPQQITDPIADLIVDQIIDQMVEPQQVQLCGQAN